MTDGVGTWTAGGGSGSSRPRGKRLVTLAEIRFYREGLALRRDALTEGSLSDSRDQVQSRVKHQLVFGGVCFLLSVLDLLRVHSWAS